MGVRRIFKIGSSVDGLIFELYDIHMYTAIYKKFGKSYSAWVLEVPGANTQGRTKKEAEINLKETLALVLSARDKYFRKELGTRKLIKIALAF